MGFLLAGLGQSERIASVKSGGPANNFFRSNYTPIFFALHGHNRDPLGTPVTGVRL